MGDAGTDDTNRGRAGARFTGPFGLPEPGPAPLSPATVATAVALAALGLVLVGFPAELFNRSLRENYARLRRVLPWVRPDAAGARRPWPVHAALFTVNAGLAGAFVALSRADALDGHDAALVAGAVAAGVLVTMAAFELGAAVAARRLRTPPRRFRAYPGALPVAACFVAVSALAGFHPPYVYGHLASFTFAEPARVARRDKALVVVAGAGSALVVAVLAWVAAGVTTSPVVDSVLAGVVVVGLNRLVFGLAPLTFLDGAAVWAHSRRLWAATHATATTVFALLVLLPSARAAAAPAVASSAALFAVYGALSFAVWARLRHSAPSSREGSDDPFPARRPAVAGGPARRGLRRGRHVVVRTRPAPAPRAR